MREQWSPGEGERVYIDEERLSGRIMSCDADGDAISYLVELDGALGAIVGDQSQRWGYEQPELRHCSIEELTPG